MNNRKKRFPIEKLSAEEFTKLVTSKYYSPSMVEDIPYECELTGVPGNWCQECSKNRQCDMQ